MSKKKTSIKMNEFVLSDIAVIIPLAAIISIVLGLMSTNMNQEYASLYFLINKIQLAVPILYYFVVTKLFKGRPKSWGESFRYEKELKVWKSYSAVKHTASVILFESLSIILFILSFSNKKMVESGSKSLLFLAYLIIPLLLIFICVLARFVFSWSLQKSLTDLKKVTFTDLISKNDIVWVDSNCGFRCADELFFEKKGLDLNSAYCFDDDLFKRIFKGQSLEDAKNRVHALCYFTSTESKEEIIEIIDKLISDNIDENSSNIKSIVVLNRRVTTGSSLLENEYDKREFLVYSELTSFEDISPSVIYSFINKRDNIYDKKDGYGSENIKYYFHAPNEFLEKINVNNQFDMRRPSSNWLGDFYLNAISFVNCSRSVMAILDYQELILRLVAIYYYQKNQLSDEQVLFRAPVGGTFTTLCEEIIRGSVHDEARHNKLTETYYAKNSFLDIYFDKLKDYLYIQFKGDRVSFAGIVSLIKKLRDKFIAHGTINHENAAVLWGLLFWATVVLNNYLDMAEFNLVQNGNEFLIGYGDDLISAGDLIWNDNGAPCIILNEKAGKKTYVNYFDGKSIIPEYISV